MPLREGNRVSFSRVECQRLLEALEVARDTLAARARDPATDEEQEMTYEAISATFDQLREDIRRLAVPHAAAPPTEDR